MRRERPSRAGGQGARRGRLAWMVCWLLVLGLVGPAQATTTDVCVVGGTVAASWWGGPIGFIVSGTAEILYAGAVATTGIGDPPDLVNFATRADPPLLIPHYTDDPNVTRGFNNAAGNLIDSMSEMFRDMRGVLQSLDRLGGAEQVGTAKDVENQVRWLQEYTDSMFARSHDIGGQLHAFVPMVETEFRTEFNTLIPTRDIKQMRDQEAAGNFPQSEQDIIDAWQMTPFELDLVKGYFAAISDGVIDAVAPLTYGESLQCIAGGFESLELLANMGDANLDGIVDDADLSLLLAHWKQDVTGDPDGGWGKGEFDGSAPVGDNDLSLLLSNWTAGAGVPEPVTLSLLAAGALVLVRRRR